MVEEKEKNQNEKLGLKSIAEYQKQGRIKEFLTLNWIFQKWYEKIILGVFFWLGIWKLLNLLNIIKV